MSARPSELDQTGRFLLESVLERVREGQPITDLIGPRLNAARVEAALARLTHANAHIDWVAVNGERIDAVLDAGDAQWRVVVAVCSSATRIETLDVFERPRRFDGVAGGQAIVVNGPSGAGKSVLLRSLQQLAPVPLVILDEPEQIGTVQTEYLIWRERAPALHRGYLDAIGALARAGNHVAVPAAGHTRAEFANAFGDVPTLTVGLTCDLAVLTERERRSGRWGGIATASPAIHDGWDYDLEFDTTDEPDPLDMARLVLSRVGPGSST